MRGADEMRGFGSDVLNSCLEQNIKNNSQFRHMKHVFLCREDMLAGTFAKNQFSHPEGTFLSADEIPSPDLAISVSESRPHNRNELNSPAFC